MNEVVSKVTCSHKEARGLGSLEGLLRLSKLKRLAKGVSEGQVGRPVCEHAAGAPPTAES